MSLRQDLDDARRQPAVLSEHAHRPWPLPRAPWVMGQTWHRLLFAHWPVDPDAVRRVMHPSIPLDTWEGRAWITVSPFTVRGMRARLLPPPPGVAAFPELNVRTYATIGGKPGVYFFSLDAGEWPAVLGARLTYRLPYFRAEMAMEPVSGGGATYTSHRIHGPRPADYEGRYEPTGPVANAAPGSLDYWLAERYCAYTPVGRRGRVMRADIHHPPWPLQPARMETVRNTMTRPLGIELDGDPLLHYVHRQDVIFWPLLPA